MIAKLEGTWGARIAQSVACLEERSGSVVDCLTRDRGDVGFEPHWRYWVVVLEQANLS